MRRQGRVSFPPAVPVMRWGRRATGLEGVGTALAVPALFGAGKPGTASFLEGEVALRAEGEGPISNRRSRDAAERARRLARLEEVTFAERDVYGRVRRMGLEMVVTTRWAVPMGSRNGMAVAVEFSVKGGGR